ncbi:variant erythrocyte surface antigen-1 family protein, partial [Babesia divergens]
VLRTLRSVLTGSLEPLTGIGMVCYMYYTDVFVGHNNDIVNLKNALEAELKESGLKTVDLTQLTALADGLKSFIGYSGGVLNGNGIGKKDAPNFSSYEVSNASWEKLCKDCKCNSNSCKSCSCSSGSSGVCSNPSKCCPDCDVRKAAKIFLGMLPCLYYALKYLYKQCEGEWNALNIQFDSKGNGSNDLTKFLHGMGFTDKDLNTSLQGSSIPSLLNTLFTGSPGSFEKLYNIVSKEYFSKTLPSSPCSSSCPSPSDSPSQPKTVRSILLWLYGLRFQKSFPSLVSHCSALCLPFGNSFNPDAFCYYIYTCCFLLPVSFISVIQCPDGSDSFLPSPSDWEDFSYPSDTLELFEKFCDFVREIYIPLTFLKFQCERTPAQAGWQNCYFGSKCAVKLQSSSGPGSSSSPCCSTSAPKGYLCTASGSNKDVHGKHCGQNGGGKGCINASSTGCSDPGHNLNSQTRAGQKCSNPCPHPLQRFLVDDSSSLFKLPSSFARLDFSQTPPVILPSSSEFLTMGFKDLPEKARQGNSIAPILNSFCGSKTSPLTKLFEFSLFVAMRPPETLIELIAFFLQFRLNLGTDPLKDHFPQYASMEPGTPDGAALQNALVNLFKHSSHSADLQSLYACDVPTSISTCGRYLFPLYNINGVFTKEFCAVYLSYVCHLGKALKALLEKFHEEAKGKFSSCCSSGSCKKIVECPCALPFLYSYGFTFMLPSKLSDSNKNSVKSCSDFLKQLEKVVKGDPFKVLLRIIDEFIWHIRLPFIYAFLYIWIIVISYFYYVQFYKLDLLHIDSHLHLPRSFKILPSTLFSDASSKLKDLSYFTL